MADDTYIRMDEFDYYYRDFYCERDRHGRIDAQGWSTTWPLDDYGVIQPDLATGQPGALSRYTLRRDLGGAAIVINIEVEHKGTWLPKLHVATCWSIHRRGRIVTSDAHVLPFDLDLRRAYLHELDLEAAGQQRRIDFCRKCLLDSTSYSGAAR